MSKGGGAQNGRFLIRVSNESWAGACASTPPGQGTHQIMQNPPAELQSVKRGIFISACLIALPLKTAFRIIKLETYGNYWTWPWLNKVGDYPALRGGESTLCRFQSHLATEIKFKQQPWYTVIKPPTPPTHSSLKQTPLRAVDSRFTNSKQRVRSLTWN